MADLLIRNIDDETKRALAIRAAEKGHSQQAEALALLREALQEEPKSWIDVIRERAQAVDGMEFDAPPRHIPRFTAVELS